MKFKYRTLKKYEGCDENEKWESKKAERAGDFSGDFLRGSYSSNPAPHTTTSLVSEEASPRGCHLVLRAATTAARWSPGPAPSHLGAPSPAPPHRRLRAALGRRVCALTSDAPGTFPTPGQAGRGGGARRAARMRRSASARPGSCGA